MHQLSMLNPPLQRNRNGHRYDDTYRLAIGPMRRTDRYDPTANAVLFEGRCQDLLASMPNGCVQLVVTSPPYNIGKSYEHRTSLEQYVADQATVVAEVVRVVSDGGSICWQVGNHVNKGEVTPLDAVLYPIFKSHRLKLRNRIIWHYEHGLHASKRFSGRYETILWFTKGDEYHFNLDPLRVPQKYPNKKYYRGPRVGELSGNPRGKSPGDVWIIPNVKWNHVEKTKHPCQFPVELIERLVLSMTRRSDLVLDPYGGVGSSVLAAVLNGRRGAMAEVVPEYIQIINKRLDAAEAGQLRTRPMDRPVYTPPKA